MTRQEREETYANVHTLQENWKGIRPARLIDVIRVRMDVKEGADDRGKSRSFLATNVNKVGMV